MISPQSVSDLAELKRQVGILKATLDRRTPPDVTIDFVMGMVVAAVEILEISLKDTRRGK